ncbi:LOW QUALITY PROTEIN: NUTM2A isoform 1 [Pongo abelii]|uniref:NUTM2A isoform 1 n=1 Tax=Pongo abelii TaxID=9601 RepID=A0A2J8XWC2_PONAB|nr:LOW QUALITY PROTEIN: NUTM2A isoform 1 [Pongo abelii]
MEVKRTSGRSFCCESKGQFKSCLKRCTPSLLLPSSWKGNSGSCLMAEAPHRMSPTPTSCPLPLPLCRMSGVLCSNLFTFKFYLLHLDSGATAEPGHSLGPTLDFSHCGNCQTTVVSAQPEGMASNGAYPVLGPGMTVNPGTSLSVFTALPFTTPAPSLAHGLPLVTAGVPPGSPLVLSAFPSTPLVAGQDGRGPSGAGASNVFVQIGTEMGPANAPQVQTLVLTQAPLVWQAPGTLCGGVVCPPPLLLAAAPVVPVMAPQVVGGTQAGEGGWSQGLPLPPPPPPAAQLPPIMSQGNAGPWPQGAHGEGSLASSQAKALPDDSCNPKSVYENFRLWQHYKPLARRHLPQSPDTEALSCFLIPVLRSLARRKPTMTLEEGLWRAMREWQHTSNFDRMIFYEMAEKFLEFEAEEEMQIQKLQWMKGPQCLPPPATSRLEPRGPPAPEVVKQPVYLPSKAGPKAPTACLPPPRPQRPVTKARLPPPRPHRRAETKARLPPPRPQRPAETKVPEEIPPEVVQEYMDIMEELLGPSLGATGEPEKQREEGEVKQPQEEDWTPPDPGLLSYIDKLCSQKDFVTKVEAVIHPRFLEELLSPDPQMDFLALSQELEQEEGLTLAQLVEKRLLTLKEKQHTRAAPSHGTAQLDSSSSKFAAGQGAERDIPDPQQGVGMETCPPQTATRDPQGRGRAHTGMARSKDSVVLLGCQDSPGLRAARPTSPPQDHRPTSPGLGSKDALDLPGGSPVRESHGLAQGSSEEEELPSLAFLLGSQHKLLPWWLPQSPVPASGLLSPEKWGPQGTHQSPSAQRRGLSLAPSPATKSKKRPLFGSPSPAEKTPHPGPGLRVSGEQSLTWGLGGPSQSQKRKGDPLVSRKKKKQRCSQ